ncbi:unnamed protein product [Mycena citricolor]|uniref:Uncharacterized protein n=1 Tax=Mycena citricolor TaxID=2018698 RepID=A0AAD2GZ34_9AGAR|nr:unnamed protein product [Mycena citricolor]
MAEAHCSTTQSTSIHPISTTHRPPPTRVTLTHHQPSCNASLPLLSQGGQIGPPLPPTLSSTRERLRELTTTGRPTHAGFGEAAITT